MKRKQNSCKQCARNQRAIRELEERLLTLEQEINGPPAEQLMEEFEEVGRTNAGRWAAMDEFNRLEQEAFYETVPWLKEVSQKRKERYEAFMKGRGFEP